MILCPACHKDNDFKETYVQKRYKTRVTDHMVNSGNIKLIVGSILWDAKHLQKISTLGLT